MKFVLIFLVQLVLAYEPIIFWSIASFTEPNYAIEIPQLITNITELEKKQHCHHPLFNSAIKDYNVWKFLTTKREFVVEPTMPLKQQFLAYKSKLEYLTCLDWAWLFDYPKEVFGDGSLEAKYWYCRELIHPTIPSVREYLKQNTIELKKHVYVYKNNTYWGY